MNKESRVKALRELRKKRIEGDNNEI